MTDQNTLLEVRAFIAGIAAGAAVLTRVGIIKINPHVRQQDGEERFLTPEAIEAGIIEAGEAAIAKIESMDPNNH